MKKILSFLVSIFVSFSATAHTLDQCCALAEQNYPLIAQYDLIGQSQDITVSNIKRGWLPQLMVSGQVSYQSDATAFPEQIQNLYNQLGIEMSGLNRLQYKVGVDLKQPLYDGSISSGQSSVAKRQTEVEKAKTAVDLYDVRRRVEELFFGILLLNEQIENNKELQKVLLSNENMVEKMYLRGVVSQSQMQTIKAERLTANQKTAELDYQKQILNLLLNTFCGEQITDLERPADITLSNQNSRPELQLFDAQENLISARLKELNSAITPQIGLFASAFYGYPGYNLFDDMMHHTGSLNAIVGARLTWNIGGFYTRKNDKNLLALKRQMIDNRREVFLFHNKLANLQETAQISKYDQLIREDDEIISLRTAVRQASESKLENGTIDINDLLREIFNENNAKVQHSIHSIERLKHIYSCRWNSGEK